MLKTLSAVLLIWLCILAPAGAEESLHLYSDLFSSPVKANWATLGLKESDRFPVYAAPFENAWRPASGKAQVAVSETFHLFGVIPGGFCLIEYGIQDGANRIGWARIPGTFPEGDMYVSRKLLRVKKDTDLTDDPGGKRAPAAHVTAGQGLIGMDCLRISGREWAYVETQVEGRPAWLFAPAEALEAVPLWHMEGDTLVIHEGVTCLGSMKLGEAAPEEGEDPAFPYSIAVRPGDVSADTIWLGYDVPANLEGIVFPSTLRAMGGESIAYGAIDVITLPEGLTSFSGLAFYASSIGILRFPSGFDGPVQMIFDATSVERYEAEEGSAYSTRDGVLFSADGTVLIAYPDVKTDTHYDVPKGTKVIGAHAFDSDRMLNPLKTISLPLGLERIEGMAFSGCGRLQSLTVPLTVKYVSPNAFYNCVSLERLSLPQGITVDGIGSWAESGDTDRYNGDNGLTEVGNGYGGTAGYEAYIDPADGSNAARCVTGSNEPVSLPAGTIVRVMTNEAGRSVIYCDAVGGLYWADSGDLQPMTGLAYFDVTDMRIEPGTLHPVDGSVLDPAEWRANIWQEAGILTECSFENGDEWIELPAYSVRFYTDSRQDGRVFGMLATAPGELAVRIYDRPGGSQVARAYPLTECEILEKGNGVVRIRTPLAEGWVYSDQVRIAEVQEKE